jgi:hypothetical protein
MTNTYLDKFRSTLPTTQGNQILRLLIGKRDSGEIRTVNEFRDRLKKLTDELLSDTIAPTVKLLEAISEEDISSELFNEMLERVEDDLETIFTEADNLDEVIDAHHNLINQVALKALRLGLNELEARVTLYEFINRNGEGFDDALFNTFRESQNLAASRSDQASSLIFVDPRKSETILSEEDAQIDLIGERLLLASDELTRLTARNAAWLSNANSIRSELDVEFPDSNILNIIDEKNNTFWVIPLLLSEIRSTGAPMEVAIQLQASQDINFVEIEPACPFPMTLVGLDYLDSNSARQSLGVTQTSLTGPMRINFERVTTGSLILRLRQDNYREIQFVHRRGDSNFHKAILGSKDLDVDLDSISPDLEEMLSSEFILNDVLAVQDVTVRQRKFFEYILGFDNIRVGLNTFNERGIFVSKKKTVQDPGQAALKVNEVRPIQNVGTTVVVPETHVYPAQSDAEDGKYHHGTIEYYLAAQFYTEEEFLISTDILPFLPLGASRIYHENIVFTKRSSAAVNNPDIASLRFFTDADSTDVKIYRNGTLLTYSTHWDFIANGHASEATLETPNAGSPMRRGIQILDTVSVLDIYTVSYTPKTSNTRTTPDSATLLDYVDLVGDRSVRMVRENVIVFGDTRGSQEISHVDLYLIILMRSNSANQNVSPAVEDYMLTTGSRSTTKFVSD